MSMRGTDMSMRISIDDGFAMPTFLIHATASSLPSPREAVGRGRGWGAPYFTMITVVCGAAVPPTLTPPRHAQMRVRGGEEEAHVRL
jgi:hypothetical protein